LQSHGVRNKKFPEAERIYREKVVFLPSGVGGVVAVEEEAAVLVDDCVLKVVECIRDGRELVLLKVML
jgi:hypothetical protein